MEESEHNISTEDVKNIDGHTFKIRSKKRSLVERELETNLTERVTSPLMYSDGTKTSRYGRARRLKTECDDSDKLTRTLKSPQSEKTPVKSPVYKMHASNSPIRHETTAKTTPNSLDQQIENIYNENISLSRFSNDKKHISPAKKSTKLYVRKDLIQTKDKEESVTLIKNYSSKGKQKGNYLSSVLQRSSERFSVNNNKQNGYLDNSSVVKTLDFDGTKKKRGKESISTVSQSDLFELEAKCEYQVGDLAWARMGTYPFWPCIITREPYSGMFVKRKLIGRVHRDVVHVTFFGDNGRRSWILENMLRKFLGLLEFEGTREKFTPEAKKKDPRCAAFFVSDKKLPQWKISVEEAETLLREPKRLRIDILIDMLHKARSSKTTPKESKKITRTDSDVSLSESLYDTLFSEDDSKTNELERSKSKTRNKSLDVSEVVTACLDNMAAKTGITKIQKQSHMDRWLQKAKSKTPEKSQLKSQATTLNKSVNVRKRNKRKKEYNDADIKKSFRLTVSDNESLYEADNKVQAYYNDHDYSNQLSRSCIEQDLLSGSEENLIVNTEETGTGFGIITKVESLSSQSMNDISNNINDEEVMSNDCTVGEAFIIDTDNVCIESSGINNVVIKDVKSIQEDVSCKINISAVTSALNGCNEPSVTGSRKQLKNTSTEHIENLDTASADLEMLKTNMSDNIEEADMDINYSNTVQNVKNSSDIQKHLTNGHIAEIDNICEVYSDHQKPINDCRKINIVLNEDSSENSKESSVISQDNIVSEEDHEKQDVNIAKTILNDKLVGNIVDSNKTDFTIEINKICTDENFTMNVHSDLTIPETNGHSNKTSKTDDCNKVNYIENKSSNYKYNKHSKKVEGSCSSTDSSDLNNKVNDKELSLHLDSPLVSTANSMCSNTFLGDITQERNSLKTDSDSESTKSERNKSKNYVINGTLSKDDFLETDSTLRNCNSYLSSEDDDRSDNSTLTNSDEYSNREKCKIRLIRKIHKNITLQDALLLKNFGNDIGPSTDDEMIPPKKVGSDIDVLVSYSAESVKSCDAMNALNIKSQKSTRECERFSTDSSYTCDSDNRSTYSDEQTESTENSETTGTMDVEESIFDSITQNGYHEQSKNKTESESVDGNKSLHVDLSQEKAILSGDELRLTPHGLEVKENCTKNEKEADTASIFSTDSEISMGKRKMRWNTEKDSIPGKKTPLAKMDDPDFLKYVELKQDAVYDEYPELSQYEITTYLYNTWLYEESLKTDRKKTDDIESANMVKGLMSERAKHPKKVRKGVKVDNDKVYESIKNEVIIPKLKPKRGTPKTSYNEEYSDIEDDLEIFRIPKQKEMKIESKIEVGIEESNVEQASQVIDAVGEDNAEELIDEVEEYFARLTEPKPNVFKGLLREKVCEICEKTGNLIKCKGCFCSFHVDCVKKETEVVEVQVPMKGRKKKKKTRGRKSKSDENSLDESQSDERDINVSEEHPRASTDNIEPESHLVANADEFEAQLVIKMKELICDDEATYNNSSGEELDWSDTEVGKCVVVDIKPKKRTDELTDYSDFKCNNCQKYDVPVCFVCRSAESPKNSALHRQRCQVAQCNKYYHLECLEHWPQTQFNSGETARYNKKINEYFEALTCPRHVCHTCVSDDPRGCKTRFCGDKLARCVRCPATYHSFTKCLPAGSQILTGSHIICPRHNEHRAGKVPCHVNTGWCFICALGGTLICCEYCPTSFHAECLNIKPPEGGYMCEDCETGRLPLYGEMVWVKLGHYRWWPGIILHPCEIPENILAVKHSPGEFVVRFFGQYDHYWVNRGRVFPFQEGDSGKISSQKSKIDAAFTMAIEHAQRACVILKSASANDEESLDIASSLLPPHYVKLRANRPCGALAVRRAPEEEGSLTQCECSPADDQPCGPYSHCLNRMLLTECGPTCRAGERCNNRAFEKRLYPKLTPYRTPHRGWGLKTLEDIKAGQFVIEYVGELIDEEEFRRRMRRKHEIRDENFYFLTLDKERMIDAGPKGNLARFMNHCCEPNCETQKWTVLGDVRVGLFALYDIPANSEVTFNYNLESAGIEKKRCLCGAKRCSGYIGAKLKQADQPKKPKRPYNKKKPKIDDSPSTSKIKPKTGKLGRPPKPKELTEIEKDLLIIKNATGSGVSSDSEYGGADPKPSKRKRVGLSTDETPAAKKVKLHDDKPSEIRD